MAAGTSAFDEAERARAQALKHERLAAKHHARADSFAKGGGGEHSLAQLLGPLSADGWHFLFDRVNPNGGNIDAIAVGPPGVAVIDNKAWNGRITVGGDRLKVGGYSKPAVLASLADAATAVAQAAGDGIKTLGVITFTTQPDLGPFSIGEQHIVGAAHLVDMLRISPAVHTAATVERLHATLAAAFPPEGTVPSRKSGFTMVDEIELGWYLSKTVSLYYANSWKKYGKFHVYLNGPSGERLGYRDLNSDTSHLEPTTDDRLAAFVIDSLTAAGPKSDRQVIPKVTTDFPMARTFAVLAKLYRAALVGGEWRGNGKHLLYGTLIHPTEGVVKLGYVDLATGFVKADLGGALLDGAATPEQLLGILRDNRPSA